MTLENQTSKCKVDLFPLTILPLSLVSNTVIRDFKLDRFEDVKVYFGRPEVQLMIEEALHNSNGHNREPKIQAILMMLFPFFMGSRPSTLGPTTSQCRDLGLVCRSFVLIHCLFLHLCLVP